ncbi:MAG: glycosyltransferase [Dongiaceae bacterium]
MAAEHRALHILLTNLVLEGWTGSEVNIRDWATGLQRRGHRPTVYSPQLGPMAELVRSAAIPVIDDIGRLGEPPDIIHGSHNMPLVVAMARFPAVPAVAWCQDWIAWFDVPAKLPGIRRYVAVSDALGDRLVREHAIPRDRVRVVLNAVDLARVVPRGPLPARPARALLYARDAAHLEPVRVACERAGLALTALGADREHPTRDPETAMAAHDIVFASGRGALEALACGAAVVLCDARGLAGMVTADGLERCRRLNFGLRLLDRPLTAEALLAEIARYDPADAGAVARRVRAEAGLDDQLARIEAVYGEALDEAARDGPPDPAAQGRALAAFLQTWLPRLDARLPWLEERAWLTEQLAEARRNLGQLARLEALGAELARRCAERDELARRCAEMSASRLWRLREALAARPALHGVARRLAGLVAPARRRG